MKISARVGAVSAAVVMSAASLVAMLPAGAATNNISSNLNGSLTVTLADASTLDLGVPTGSSFTGTYDDVSHALTGNVSIASGSVALTSPAPGSLDFSMVESGQAVGTIGADNTVTFTDSQTLKLTKVTLDGTPPTVIDLDPTCAFGPIAMTYTGTYDPTSGAVSVTSATVPVPALAENACGALTSTIQTLLAKSTVSAALQFTVAVETIAEPTTTTTIAAPPTTQAPATTMPGKPAPAAQAVTATPKYTG